MIHKEDIKKIAQQILHPKPKYRTTRLIYPMREWTIGLVIALCGLIVVGMWSAQVYLKYQGASSDAFEVGDSEVVVYREGLVQSALEEYVERELQFETLLAEASGSVEEVSDPEEEVVEVPPEEPAEEVPLREDTEEAVNETPDEEELIIDIILPE